MAAGPKLFSEHGVEKTSVREWARVNLAAVSHCFGDKAGLYRALFTEPPGGTPPTAASRLIDAPAQPASPRPSRARAWAAT